VPSALRQLATPVDARENKMHILMAAPFGPQGKGGIDRLTDLIIETMERRADLGVRVVRLTTRGNGTLSKGSLTFALAIINFWRAARGRKVDLLHIHLASYGSTYRKAILATLAARMEIPYIIHLHSGRFDEFWHNAPAVVEKAISRMFTKSEGIIVLGEYWKNVICARLPAVKDKIIVLPNATPSAGCKQSTPLAPTIHVTFLGLLGKNKGTPQLLDALGRLADRDDWRATIAGNGEIEASRARALQLGIADRVDFPGWLDPHATRSLLCHTDILTLPSFSEGLPMAILEAFAYGVAVVATPVGSVPEVIEHERNGLIVPVGDAKALADALLRLINDGDLRRRLGKAAKQDHGDRYEVNGYIGRLAAIWRGTAIPGPHAR
jgi:glycosyltransferase involved in cell wall biosynthesis